MAIQPRPVHWRQSQSSVPRSSPGRILVACSLGKFSGVSNSSGPPAQAAPQTSNLDPLDVEALEVSAGVFGIEDLAVEKGFLAARFRGRDVGGRDVERLGRVAPKIFAVDLGDQALRIVARLIFSPTDIFGEEPEIVTLERIRGVIRPIAHDVRAVLDHLARNAVVELALDPVSDIFDWAVYPLPLGADRRHLVAIFQLVTP